MLFYGDLDKLKLINDNLGHEEGDRAICDVSDILRDIFRGSDIIARIGGDEFAVLMVNADDTFDLPSEWFDAICYNLAVRLIPKFGCSPARVPLIKAVRFLDRIARMAKL